MYMLFSFLWKFLTASTPFVGVTAFNGAFFCEMEYRITPCEGKNVKWKVLQKLLLSKGFVKGLSLCTVIFVSSSEEKKKIFFPTLELYCLWVVFMFVSLISLVLHLPITLKKKKNKNKTNNTACNAVYNKDV